MFENSAPKGLKRSRITWLLAVLLVVAAAFLLTQSVLADTVIGDGTPASCTHAALQTAVNAGGSITFNCGQSAGNPVTIAITQTISIDNNVTLDGGIADQIILDGGDTGSGARNEVGLFNITAEAQVTLREITLAHAGDSTIRNTGSLTLDGVEIYYGRALACAGVQSSGRLIVRGQSIISTNQAEMEGGGACILGGTANFEDSAFQFNSAQSGGGVYVGGGALTANNAYFGSNSATLAGAGIFIAPDAQADLNFAGIADNVAAVDSFALGGGIYNQGLLNLFAGVITNNAAYDGGGIYNTGNLTINASDVEENTADSVSGRGGNLFNSGQAQYSTSSLVRGQAANGGGFYNSGLLTLTNATVSQNTATVGGNLSGGGDLHLRYSTLAQNAPEDLFLLNANGDSLGSILTACVFDAGNLMSLGYNLDSGDTCGFAAPGDLTQTDPLLGVLQSSEGRYTWYHAPAEDSPAVDGGESTCPEAENRDQHNAARPAGAACDIGAVEVGGVIPTATPTQPATSEPTATPSPGATATRTASPTPTEAVLVTPTATPEGPYVFPAPQTTPQTGFTIQLSHSEGRPGDLIQVTGSGASRGVRLTWANDQITFSGADVPVQSDGSYQATLRVPDYFGDLQVCAATGDPRRARFICTNFFVDASENSSLIVNFAEPLPSTASVQVLDHAGNILYTANGENDTSITLTGLTPGAYHISVMGASYALGQANLAPGLAATTQLPKMVDTVGVDPVSGDVCYRNAAIGRVQAKYSYTGFYTTATLPDPVARRGAMAVEKAWVSNNFSYLAPQAEFGTFISNVILANEFRANLTGDVGSVQKVEYWARGEGQANWTKIGESTTAPYAVAYNVGLLPPGTAQILVAPVINNQRQCGTSIRVNMVANPVDNDFISNKVIVWSATEQQYRFTGYMPNFPFLPFAYQSDPWEVDPLGDIATVLNAGVRVVGTIQLNQVMHLTTAELETTVQVLGVRPEGLNNQINLLPGGALLVNPNNPQSLALSTGRMHLGELFSISVNTPKIVAFSYFGIVNAYVRFSFGMSGDLYMQATLYPLAPGLEVIVEPQASANFGVIIGADVLFGLVDGSAEVGAAASLGLPLRIYAAPEEFSIGFNNPNFCLYGYIQFHWSAVWGAFGGSSPRQPFFDIPGGCAPNRQIAASNAPPRVLALPVMTGDSSGQMFSIYIEDAAPDAPTAAPVVMVRQWDSAAQNWLPPLALTQPGGYVASPTIALLGESGQALAAWVQSNQTEAQSQTGDVLTALNEMEIFAAFYDGAAWGEPFRLTEDSLPDGNPALAADDLGATLVWVHHSDGDLTTPGGAYLAVRHWDGATWSPVEFLDGGSLQTYGSGANPVSAGTRQAANNSQPSVARTTLGVQSEIAIAWTYESDNQKRVVVAHNRAEIGAWYMLDTSSLPAYAHSPFVTLPAGQAQQVELAFSAASPGTDGSVPNLGNLSVIWTARLLDEGESTAVTAAPLQDAAGVPVRGEKPELQIGAQGERLLTFRHFGTPGSPSETGQIAVSRAVGSAAFAAPLDLTSGVQHWQGSAFINPVNNNLMLLSVQANRFQPFNLQQTAATQLSLPTQWLTAAGEDTLMGLAYPAEADPAIQSALQISQLHLPAGETAILTATVQNLGRENALVRVRWWQGDVETGTLLATSGLRTLAFNQAYPFTFALPVNGGSQTITAEIVAVGGNRETTNDTAALDVGILPAPRIASISPTPLFENALQIAYHPAAAPGVAGYRILRRAADSDEYQLVGETIGVIYYDASLQAGVTYCYVVQAYDALGEFSPDSPEECRSVVVDDIKVYLPLIVR